MAGIVAGNASAFIIGGNAEPPARVLKRATLDALYFSGEKKEEIRAGGESARGHPRRRPGRRGLRLRGQPVRVLPRRNRGWAHYIDVFFRFFGISVICILP